MKRSWKIEVPEGQRIKLDVLFLNLEDDKLCSKDSVIFKHSSDSRKFISYCGTTLPTGYLSTGNVVYVVFQSDEFTVGTGFKIHFQAVSGNHIFQNLTRLDTDSFQEIQEHSSLTLSNVVFSMFYMQQMLGYSYIFILLFINYVCSVTLIRCYGNTRIRNAL